MSETLQNGIFGSNPYDSDQITRDYLDSLLLETRYINADLPSTKMELYGETFDTPIMTAALSHLHKICDNAMVEIALGAKECNAVHWVGMGEDKELEDIVASGARTIKIIKPHADNKEVFHKIEHAIKSGVFAVGMDIDHAFTQDGRYDTVLDLPMHPKTQEDIKEYVKAAGDVPFILKGIQSVTDARLGLEAGVQGLLISHHHNMMRYSVPPLMVLPEIVKAVNGAIPVFVDCGIVSGIDAYKALALGATAVCVGRELMGPLESGHEGVAHRMTQMNNELATIMARTGVKTLNDMDSTVIWHRNF